MGLTLSSCLYTLENISEFKSDPDLIKKAGLGLTEHMNLTDCFSDSRIRKALYAYQLWSKHTQKDNENKNRSMTLDSCFYVLLDLKKFNDDPKLVIHASEAFVFHVSAGHVSPQEEKTKKALRNIECWFSDNQNRLRTYQNEQGSFQYENALASLGLGAIAAGSYLGKDYVTENLGETAGNVVEFIGDEALSELTHGASEMAGGVSGVVDGLGDGISMLIEFVGSLLL